MARLFFSAIPFTKMGDDLGGNFPGIKVANRGISGDTTRGVLIRLDEDVLT